MALGLLRADPRWRDTAVVRALVAAVPAEAWAASHAETVLTPGGPHFVPPAYAKLLPAAG